MLNVEGKLINYLIFISLLVLSFDSFSLSAQNNSSRDELVEWLREYIDVNEIKPLRSEPFELTGKYFLGQALFFDPILSTNKDISCATCHLVKGGTSDGLNRSIGTGGEGLAEQRHVGVGKIRQDRNAPSLWNLDNNAVKNLFWDGRIEVLDHVNDIYRSPLNELLPKNIENALAAQALFPIVSEGEMYSVDCRLSGSDLDICLRMRELLKLVDRPVWISTYHTIIMDRLLGKFVKSSLTHTQRNYREMVQKAYSNVSIEYINFGHLGNAIAHFEEVAFATRGASWDAFIKGNDDALSVAQLQGAKLFFGKADCVRCHNGPLFSDFEFHSLGIVSVNKTSQDSPVDEGRALVTKNKSDLFKFRTALLRNATLTKPYMHDGSIETLNAAILRHFEGCKVSSPQYQQCKTIVSSDWVDKSVTLSKSEVDNLIQFISSLEDNAKKNWGNIIPNKVPSGLEVHKLPTVNGSK